MERDREHRWLHSVLILVLLSVLCRAGMLMLAPTGLQYWEALDSRLARVMDENRQKRVDILAKERHIRQLRASTESIERTARDQLGLIRDGEIIIQFPTSR